MVRKKSASGDQPRGTSGGRAGCEGVRKRLRKRKEQVLGALSAINGKKRSPAEKPAPPPAPPARRQKAADRAKSRPVGRRKASRPELSKPKLQPVGPPSSLNIVPPPPPAPASGYVERGPDLPAGYGGDRVVAMVRDPRCVFVYWEIKAGGWERIRRDHGEAEASAAMWVLRLEQLAEPPSLRRFYDVPIDPEAGSWYLYMEPETDYLVRLGAVLTSGSFCEFAASEGVSTPAETPCSRTDAAWMVADGEFDRIVRGVYCPGSGGPGGSSDLLLKLELARRGVRLFSGALPTSCPTARNH